MTPELTSWSDLLSPVAIAGIDMTWLDALAFLWFALSTIGYGVFARYGPAARNNLIAAIQRQREAWMVNMARRADRVTDVLLVSNLATGNTFFASTSVILLGALSALLGAGETAQQIVAGLPHAHAAPPVLWNIKILTLMAVFVYAFFKFAWAFRLAHYAMILVGAAPMAQEATEGVRLEHAARTARLAGIAGEHSNSGLRAYYFAIAGCAWFYHPLAFIIATTWVLLIVIRREYLSRSLAIIGPAGH
ncbi:MAG: DUF599 domain-containing protein [Hyphomicrobiaceae bacterium]